MLGALKEHLVTFVEGIPVEAFEEAVVLDVLNSIVKIPNSFGLISVQQLFDQVLDTASPSLDRGHNVATFAQGSKDLGMFIFPSKICW